jgi:transketolase
VDKFINTIQGAVCSIATASGFPRATVRPCFTRSALAGFDLPLEELKNFRQWNRRHRVITSTPDARRGSSSIPWTRLAMSVGMAMAEKMLAARYNKKGLK